MSANRLKDGKVVYLDKDGRWTENLTVAQVFPGKSELETAVKMAKRSVSENLIIDPTTVDLKPDLSRLSPLSLRDAIRAYGPTIEFGPKPALKPD